MNEDIRADVTHSLTLWLKVNKAVQPPKSVHPQNRDGWYKARAEELAHLFFKAYAVKIKPELKQFYSGFDG